MNQTSFHCALCVAVRDATGSSEPPFYNRILGGNSQFLVVPSLGPLVPGHVMVVSREHHLSLAAMGRDGVDAYEDLAHDLLPVSPWLASGDLLEAEHGASSDDKAGACVVHTHIHWIPAMGRFFEDLAARLPRRPETSVANIPRGEPYIFLRANSHQAIFSGHDLPSQTVRRLLCELLDRDDFDWKQSLRSDWVKETAEAWIQAHNRL